MAKETISTRKHTLAKIYEALKEKGIDEKEIER